MHWFSGERYSVNGGWGQPTEWVVINRDGWSCHNEILQNKNNEVYALEDNDSAKEWIKEKVTEITKEEADNITNPPPTKEQLIAKAEYDKQALIAEVQSETQLLQTKHAMKRIRPDKEPC